MDFDIEKTQIAWGSTVLSAHGYTLHNDLPEQIQLTPWSQILRFYTDKGYVYLKHTPKLLGLEANIIQLLQNKFHAHVPCIIAHNPDLNCFLMKDAGESLRAILKSKFDENLVLKTVEKFTSLQLSVADHINEFIDIGVPDWRLDKLPDLYQQLISQKDFLIEDGLSENEINKLQLLVPYVVNVCKDLSKYSIKPSIVQPDFNDNNTLINTSSLNITIIDLGEIVISHPFFSLINFLHVLKKHHRLADNSEIYQKIRKMCFKNYMDIISEKQLPSVLKKTRLVYFIYAALSCHRLKIACDKSQFTGPFANQGRPSMPLKSFINACENGLDDYIK